MEEIQEERGSREADRAGVFDRSGWESIIFELEDASESGQGSAAPPPARPDRT